jgi:Asp-tRNA(Asn)/Glu-tRNA(Gln) amidotransferase B subunit
MEADGMQKEVFFVKSNIKNVNSVVWAQREICTEYRRQGKKVSFGV